MWFIVIRHGFGASAPTLLWLVWPCGSSGELETRRPVGRVHGSFCCGTWILWIWMMRKQAVTKNNRSRFTVHMFMHVYCPCILRMFMWRSKRCLERVKCLLFSLFCWLRFYSVSIAGGRGAGGAASVQAKLCGRLLQSWPWSSVAAGNRDTLAFSNLCIAMGYISALPFPSKADVLLATAS